MFVLGVDPGLTRTGYGLLRQSSSALSIVSAGVISTSSADATPTRLAELADDLAAIIREHEPDGVAIERVFVNRNLQTAMSVARASGVVMLEAARAGLPVAEYTPSAVKMALTGYGAAEKEQIQKVVAMRLGLDHPPEPADTADALAVALCHIQSHRLTALGVTR